MDETLLITDKSFDKERFTEIYKEFKKRDIILAITSGNSYPKLNVYFSYMENDDLYFASDNGNYIVKSKEVIDYDELRTAAEYLENLADYSIIFSDGENNHYKWINPEFEEHVLSFNKNLNLINSFDAVKNFEIVKVASHSSLPFRGV